MILSWIVHEGLEYAAVDPHPRPPPPQLVRANPVFTFDLGAFGVPELGSQPEQLLFVAHGGESALVCFAEEKSISVVHLFPNHFEVALDLSLL